MLFGLVGACIAVCSREMEKTILCIVVSSCPFREVGVAVRNSRGQLGFNLSPGFEVSGS